MVNGIRTYRDGVRGAERGRNTVYVFHLDDLIFCHLGDLGHELDTHQIEEIGNVDVLFVPAYSSLTSSALTEVISQIEARVVVPLYDQPKELERLAHELGVKELELEDKLSVTSATLPAEGEETRVVIFAAHRYAGARPLTAQDACVIVLCDVELGVVCHAGSS